MAEQASQLQTQMQAREKDLTSYKKQVEEVRKERQELFEKCLQSEQTLSDAQRDSELKEIKIESLQNIITKRE